MGAAKLAEPEACVGIEHVTFQWQPHHASPAAAGGAEKDKEGGEEALLAEEAARAQWELREYRVLPEAPPGQGVDAAPAEGRGAPAEQHVMLCCVRRKDGACARRARLAAAVSCGGCEGALTQCMARVGAQRSAVAAPARGDVTARLEQSAARCCRAAAEARAALVAASQVSCSLAQQGAASQLRPAAAARRHRR